MTSFTPSNPLRVISASAPQCWHARVSFAPFLIFFSFPMILLFRQSLNCLPAEGRQIIRFSRGDQVSVSDDLRIHIIGSCINQIVFDGKKPSRFLSFQNPS